MYNLFGELVKDKTKKQSLKPIIRYVGGKAREIKFFDKYLPVAETIKGRYVEPFIGGGSVYFYINPDRAIINDINSELINLYKDVQLNSERLLSEFSTLAKRFEINHKSNNDRLNKEEYYHIRDIYNGLAEKTFENEYLFNYLRSTLYLYLNASCFSGLSRVNKKGHFNVAFGNRKRLVTNITDETVDLLKRTEIRNESFETVLSDCQTDDFVFLDPPYHETYSSYGNSGGNHLDGFSEDQHIKLAESVKNLPCKYLMVIGETPFIRDLYKDNIVDVYIKQYDIATFHKNVSENNHLVITNF